MPIPHDILHFNEFKIPPKILAARKAFMRGELFDANQKSYIKETRRLLILGIHSYIADGLHKTNEQINALIEKFSLLFNDTEVRNILKARAEMTGSIVGHRLRFRPEVKRPQRQAATRFVRRIIAESGFNYKDPDAKFVVFLPAVSAYVKSSSGKTPNVNDLKRWVESLSAKVIGKMRAKEFGGNAYYIYRPMPQLRPIRISRHRWRRV